ncbi:hypothetical protein QWU11_46425 [Actinomadura sp. DC4]|nr:hypothetical protein [Actinomadura sp. DC4]
MAGRGHSSARAALTLLPGWVTVLGLVLVLGELTGGAVLLARSRDGLTAPGGAAQTVVLQVTGACAGDTATYTTPTGDGQFDMPAQKPPRSLANCVSHGSPTTPTLQKTVNMQPGGKVTINTFNGYADFPLTCSITMNGKVLSQVVNNEFWGRATCWARIQ